MMKRIKGAARRQATVSERGLLAHPWMTTAGLMALNIALAAALVVSPSAVRAEQQWPRPFCNWCWEGWYEPFELYSHATERFPGSKKKIYQDYIHRNNRVHPGTCVGAHPRSVCCALPD